MAITFYNVKEGEFVRLIESQSISKIIAQESADSPLKFHVVGINPKAETAYAVRHGRTNVLRTWRLDNLGMFLKELHVTSWEVQYKY
ncbi:hypothetical protein HNW13_017805 [Shewanella sp. BF02_Schw]|uniref:hypothetical protein n=1 Tax=Shewanella sp. BF02_Schw TaxID=394908 RepID=UPI001AA13D26|nr:hypothetical protein [Shewanella sp. BF02_Schw]MBO1897595.1 hypothetical protein [Shewanella sp. BF02_Schw]